MSAADAPLLGLGPESGAVPASWAGWAVLGLGVGMLAGAVGRVLLRRLPRGAAVSPPWCELAVGGIWAAVGGAAGAALVPWTWVPLLAATGWLGVVAGLTDLRHHRLPDALTLPALPVALLLTVPVGPAAVGRAAAGAGLLAGAYLLVHLVSPAALGLGDVKLAAPLGAILAAVSWPALLLGCALAAGISGIMGGLLLARELCAARLQAVAGPGQPELGPVEVQGKEGRWTGRAGRGRAGRGRRPAGPGAPPVRVPSVLRRRELPHGPSMLVAAWIVAFAGAVQAGASAARGGMVAG